MKLPDASNINRSVRGPATVPTQVASTAPIGQGIIDVGRELSNIGDRRAKLDHARAKSDFLRRKVELDGSFDQDRDWGTMSKRYEESARKALEESSKLITNDRARSLFMEDAQVEMQRGIETINDFAFTVEADESRAMINTMLTESGQAALSAKSDDEFNSIYNNVTMALEGAVESGFYSAEKAGQIDQAWQGKNAADKISLMPAAERAEALNQSWARHVPTQVKASLLEQAVKDEREEKAFSIVDDMYGQGYSLIEMNREVRQIEDRELRKEVERRRDYVMDQDARAVAQSQDEFYENYGMKVRMGEMEFSEIPRQTLEFMTLSQVDALKKSASDKLSGKQVDTDRGAYAEFYEIYTAGQYEKARTYIYENADKFTDSDFQSLIAKASKEDEKAQDIESARTLSQMIDQTLVDAGVKNVKNEKGSLLSAYDKQYQIYQSENDGKKPDDVWTQKVLDDLAIKQRVEKKGLFNDMSVRRYEFNSLGGIPENHTQAVLSVMPDNIDIENAEAAYNDAMLVFSGSGIVPTSEDIADMIEARRAQTQGQ